MRQQVDYLTSANGDNKFWELGANITWDNGSYSVIGKPNYPFRGTFDGKGFTLTLGDVVATGDNFALFGNTTNATIKNLNIKGVKINANNHAGFLIGVARGTTVIHNVHVEMSAESYSTRQGWGGLIGILWNDITTTITSCSVIGSVTISS
jgi:hypothetical protein